jgi:hypothetical protein
MNHKHADHFVVAIATIVPGVANPIFAADFVQFS